jgi:hypothetical protein
LHARPLEDGFSLFRKSPNPPEEFYQEFGICQPDWNFACPLNANKLVIPVCYL